MAKETGEQIKLLTDCMTGRLSIFIIIIVTGSIWGLPSFAGVWTLRCRQEDSHNVSTARVVWERSRETSN